MVADIDPSSFPDGFVFMGDIFFFTAGDGDDTRSLWKYDKSAANKVLIKTGSKSVMLDYLAEHQIGIEMCPLSNVATNVVDSIEEHPIRRYFDRGLLVTVNTDDPKMFHNSLAMEYEALAEKHGFTPDEIRIVILNGIKASWLTDERKRELTAAFEADEGWLD